MEKPLLICVIDDDDIYRYTISKNLKALNLTSDMLVFSDREQAINFMTDNVGNPNQLPDIILLDINMPVMDGFQFMEEYVKLEPLIAKEIAVYMISSSVNPQDIQRAKAVPEIADYLVKPINPTKLGAILQSLMEAR